MVKWMVKSRKKKGDSDGSKAKKSTIFARKMGYPYPLLPCFYAKNRL